MFPKLQLKSCAKSSVVHIFVVQFSLGMIIFIFSIVLKEWKVFFYISNILF